MERFFVKFKGGYLNVDQDWVYVTTSGNWQETLGLNELVSNQRLRNSSIIIWLTTLTVVGLSLWLESYFILALFILLIALNYGKSLNPPFKIPISKISKVERIESTVTLYFYNEVGEPVSQKFRKINNHDFEVIKCALQLDKTATIVN